MSSISRAPSMLGALLAALASAAAPCWSQDVTPEVAGFSAVGLKAIGSVIDQHIAAGDIPGVVILAHKRGKIVLWEARGSMDSDR